MENARSVARRSSSELTNFDVGTAEEPLILTDAQMTMIDDALVICEVAPLKGLAMIGHTFGILWIISICFYRFSEVIFVFSSSLF